MDDLEVESGGVDGGGDQNLESFVPGGRGVAVVIDFGGGLNGGSIQAETDGFSEPWWRQFTLFKSLAEETLRFNSNKVGAMGGGGGIWK